MYNDGSHEAIGTDQDKKKNKSPIQNSEAQPFYQQQQFDNPEIILEHGTTRKKRIKKKSESIFILYMIL